ncbi:hypothetical protein [Lentibacillus jeotgali]|uniref:hypothetical protein n=1 Tax=Lentibacillus jeotgali TaxID=558169 RepID=UPI0002FA0F96|nr:hypothetical protein [Lentibacillus jeotgali]
MLPVFMNVMAAFFVMSGKNKLSLSLLEERQHDQKGMNIVRGVVLPPLKKITPPDDLSA